MIDPKNVTKFDRTTAELEEWWLFSTIVAGKTAAVQARLLERFLTALPPAETPFGRIRKALESGVLLDVMKAERVGQYNRLFACWQQSVLIDLHTASLEDLEAITGIGPKTARMFLMHSRPNQRLAALDTHILKHLNEHGHVVPKSTPTGTKYRTLELAFLELADAAGQSPADYDLMVWKSYARAA